MSETNLFGGQFRDDVPHRGRPSFDWTPEQDALLGRDTDVNVGASLGVHARTVYFRRRALGIPPCRRHSRGVRWTLERVQALAKYPSVAAAVAGEGVTRQRIYQVLAKHGVRPPERWGHLCVGDEFSRSGRHVYTVLAVREREGVREIEVPCSCTRTFWIPEMGRGKMTCGQCSHAERIHKGKDPLIGKRNGRLVCIGRRTKGRIIRVRCDCGREKEIRSCNFKATQSCGCLVRERNQRRREER